MPFGIHEYAKSTYLFFLNRSFRLSGSLFDRPVPKGDEGDKNE